MRIKSIPDEVSMMTCKAKICDDHNDLSFIVRDQRTKTKSGKGECKTNSGTMEPQTSSKVDGQNVGMPFKDRSGWNKSLAGRGQIKTGKIEIEASLHTSRNMAVCDVEEDEVDLVQNDPADVKNFRNRKSKKKRTN